MSTLFHFDPVLEKDQVLAAIQAVETKRYLKQKEEWDKKRSTDTTFKDPEPAKAPTLAELQEKYKDFTKGKPLLLAYASNGAQTHIEGDAALTNDQAKTFGAVLLQVEKQAEKAGKARPDATIMGVDGKEYTLEPKELSAYLQSGMTDPVDKTVILPPVNTWLEAHNIGLTGAAHTYHIRNGKEDILIETGEGQRRCVGNGIITKPLDGYYGGVEGVIAADHDKLDIYVSKDIYKEIKAGTPYTGPVFVMQQMDKGKNDELKIGYAKNVDEFRNMQASTWDKPQDFVKNNQGKYAELTQEQYRELKAQMLKKPDLTLDEFVAAEKAKHVDIKLVTPTALPDAPAPTTEKPAAMARDDDAFVNYIAEHHTLGRGNGAGKEINASMQASMNTYTAVAARIEEDGKFGAATETRLETYQEAYGLKKDGILGIETATTMQAKEVSALLGVYEKDPAHALTNAEKTELNKELQDVKTLVTSGMVISDAAKQQVNEMLDNLKKCGKLEEADQILGQTIQDIRAQTGPSQTR